jgi:hypothetical protein
MPLLASLYEQPGVGLVSVLGTNLLAFLLCDVHSVGDDKAVGHFLQFHDTLFKRSSNFVFSVQLSMGSQCLLFQSTGIF